LSKRKPSSTSDSGKETQSLVQYLVDGIIQGVRDGQFVPGQRLIAADLAEQFQVSRAPVREAMQVLVGEGVVEFVRNRGAKIRQLSVKELIDVMEFTEAMLILGVRLATRNIDLDDNKEKLKDSFEKMEATWETKQNAVFVNSIHQFHNIVNEISGNHFVGFMYQRGHFSFFNRQLADKLPGGHWDEFIVNYRRVYETIISGDEHAAESAFSNHMQWAIDILKEYLPEKN
jgi:DNA-binding GntR family transcriptional regulator